MIPLVDDIDDDEEEELNNISEFEDVDKRKGNFMESETYG